MGHVILQGDSIEEVKRKFKEKYPNENIRSCTVVVGKKTLYNILY